MRTSTPALRALLASQQFVKCRLYTVTLISGLTYYWTDADVDVVARNQLFSSSGPSISGAQYQLVRGLQVDTFDLTVRVKDTDTIANVPWSVAVRSGALDGATVQIDKAFLASWGAPAETLVEFVGEVTEANFVNLAATLSVKSDADKLNTMVPRLTFQPGCMRTLYDAGCTVNQAAYTFAGAVQSAPNRALFFTGLTQPDGYYSLGVVVFSSGLNAGVRRAVKTYAQAQGRIALSYPLEYDLAPGDAFIVRAGCDKTLGANGCAKFNNVINFKGMPYIPKPETVL